MFPLSTSQCDNAICHRLCVLASERSGDDVCPASVKHLSRRNVPLVSTSSRRLSESRRAGVNSAMVGGSEAAGSHGLVGCQMEGWTSADRRRCYRVQTLQERREQSSREVSGHSSPSCRAREGQNISCYQVCPVETGPAKHCGRALGNSRVFEPCLEILFQFCVLP